MAALDAPYAATPGGPRLAAIVETLTILPSPRAAIVGAIAAVGGNGANTVSWNVSRRSVALVSSVEAME